LRGAEGKKKRKGALIVRPQRGKPPRRLRHRGGSPWQKGAGGGKKEERDTSSVSTKGSEKFQKKSPRPWKRKNPKEKAAKKKIIFRRDLDKGRNWKWGKNMKMVTKRIVEKFKGWKKRLGGEKKSFRASSWEKKKGAPKERGVHKTQENFWKKPKAATEPGKRKFRKARRRKTRAEGLRQRTSIREKKFEHKDLGGKGDKERTKGGKGDAMKTYILQGKRKLRA